ncbi:crossover junction endonuclease Mus81p [[Candida] railenensis]|uniref:Crossover junction endonuclease MUS81 n=1 Tax=[Candida] railenensis TaxID=45579 RepID=A0A9P0VX61_9ASCO|nr:crossover junction endonuclease Mus81p [[Candida] railenensis]
MDFKGEFKGWLLEEADIATKKGSKAALLYNKAVDSIDQVDAISDLQALKSVKYIGERTLKLLLNKLKSHCESQGVEFPKDFETVSKKRTADTAEGDDESHTCVSKPIKKRKKRIYVPAKRSGGYSILIALYTQDFNRDGLTQDEVIKHATPFCDKSFKSNPASNQFYSAWSSVKQLEKHDLVKCTGRPKRYYLTDEGLELATKLKVGEGIESPQASKIVNREETGFTEGEIDNSTADSYAGVNYTTWNSGSYEIVLIIDTREVRSQSERDFFQKTLSSSGIKCEVLPLSVGDGLWIARNHVTGEEVVLNNIFERKRIDDLAFSIRDGRFQEQKNRLKMAAMKNNYYIVEEGGFDQMGVSVSGEALQTAISMTITSSDFYLKKLKTIEDTVSFLKCLTEVLIEDFIEKRTLIVLKPSSLKNQYEYESVISMFRDRFEKTTQQTMSHESNSSTFECVYPFETFKVMMAKSMTTVKETFIQMLLCVRGVSIDKAYTIQKQFGTPKNFLDYFKRKEEENLELKEKKLLMSNLFKHHIGNKKIGPSLSEKIYEIWGDIEGSDKG